MYLPLGVFYPEVKIGFVTASRSGFRRELSEQRAAKAIGACAKLGIALTQPAAPDDVIETRDNAKEAARQLKASGCDAAVLYLGNFSPEIEDAQFVKDFGGPVMIVGAAEENAAGLMDSRGDALCGLISATLAMEKRGLRPILHIPENPIMSAAQAAAETADFVKMVRAHKGIRNATVGLFGPRPRDFESCNYNMASIASLGVEVEELGFHDLVNEVWAVSDGVDVSDEAAALRRDIANVPGGDFPLKLAEYETALLRFRDRLRLSGMATQCWTEQEHTLHHLPCAINARLAEQGCPVACENDLYSVVSELLCQYVSGGVVTVLDLNHSVPHDLHPKLANYPAADILGMFHCGNTSACRMKNAEMKHHIIMKRNMEPDVEPNITRGTLEGTIDASPITILQIHGVGDRLRAYIAEGEFLDMNPKTFGSTGTAYIPGFGRFYRHVALGKFHHHCAVAFAHIGKPLFDTLKLLGVDEIHTVRAPGDLYPGENPFKVG